MGILGIRRETKSQWERRTPLIPEHVHELIKREGIEVVVESSERRVFTDEEYRKVGARIQADLKDVPIIFGVKEIPVDLLEPGKVYVYFSHVIKGQPQNMAMLQRLLDLKCTLIDYEKVTDANGKRLIAFGYFAGVAGMGETLWALGQRWKALGYETPLARLQQPYRYPDLAALKKAVAEVGQEIQEKGFPEPLTPVIVGFTGSGNVFHGTQEVFSVLPFEDVEPENIREVLSSPRNDRFYRVVFKKEHMVEPIDPTKTFSREEYYQHPERYRPIFERYVGDLTVLVNGIYWDERFPRYVTKAFARRLFETQENPRLTVVGDITCDVGGSIEFTVKATMPDQPVYVYDPLTDEIRDGVEGRGIVVMAVEILPSELPKESSIFFSNQLRPFVPAIVRADYHKPYEALALPPEIHRAVIVHNGQLTPPYKYLSAFLKRSSS